MKVALVGHLFSLLCQMFLKPKQIPILVTKEQSITVKIAEDIMDIYLRMAPNLQAKGSVTIVFAWYLSLKNNKINNKKNKRIF